MSRDNNVNQLDIDALEAQGKEIASLLDAHAEHLSMRTLKQLENGREHATNTHAQATGTSVNVDGTLSQLGAWAEHHRLAFIGLVAAMVVLSYFAIETFNINETSDAFLLSAELPPEAFVDRGFEPSLNQRENI